MSSLRRQSPRSLRTILIVWFLLFSLVPLAFVTGYSIIKFEKAIDNELQQRLSGNSREVMAIFNDFEAGLRQKRERHLKDSTLVYQLSTSDAGPLRAYAKNWLKADFSTGLSFFNRDGRMLLSLTKETNGEIKEILSQAAGAIYLSDQNLEKIKPVKEYGFIEFTNPQKVSLIFFSKVFNSSGRFVGLVEQVVDLDQSFMNRLKSRMKLEIALIRPGGQVAVGTHSDFALYKKEFLQDYLKNSEKSFFELGIRGTPFGFMIQPVSWGQSEFFIALGASKVDAKAVLKNVNYAFYSVVGTVIVLLILTILLTSSKILRPLNDLVEAIQTVTLSDRPIEIPIKSDTEIGLLTESFNQMSRQVAQARQDLKKKITELEQANLELKETQSKLVHSSKMVSLGQLVAGVAHELNNPIGFIYSNMTHLKEYSDKLIEIAEVAERDPSQVRQLIEAYDLRYIKEDLPKLVGSCQDGARRTKDIVLGLRNFSRLEEAKLKEVDLHEGIESTLNLLQGEIKNRVQIVKNYGAIPVVTCYASQINQVFMNLLSNAVQAIEGPGNIWITTKVEQASAGKKLVKISFQDSGSGMPAEVMEKIFDPFFSTKGVGQGTGLGLSISYGIIQSHGGDIQVKSQLGIGTEFIITIPTTPTQTMSYFETSDKKMP